MELQEPAGITAHPLNVNLVELWRLGRGHGFELVGYTPDGNPLYNAQDGTGPYNLEGQVVEGASFVGGGGGRGACSNPVPYLPPSRTPPCPLPVLPLQPLRSA